METIVVGIASVAVALGTLAWMIWTRWYDRRSGELLIFVVDPRGDPKTDVTLLGPSGVSLSPDGRGMASIPRSWAKKSLSIHDRRTWRELMKVRLSGNGEVPEKIVIPDE